MDNIPDSAFHEGRSTRHKIGDMLQGFGAGYRGAGQEFIAGREELHQSRKEALVKDARKTMIHLKNGDVDSAVGLLRNRVDAIGKLGGDPKDTVGVLQLLESGDIETALRELQTVDEAAVATGMLEPMQKHIGVAGNMGVTMGPDGSYRTQQLPGVAAPEPKVPNSVQEYQYAQDQGYRGSYSEFLESRTRGVNINMGGELISKPPAGYAAVQDPSNPSGYRYEQIPGGPVEAEAEAEALRAARRQEGRASAGTTVIQDLQRAFDLIPEIARGEGVVGANARKTAAGVYGTRENLFVQFVESALSNVGLDTLQQMRDNSPTGGALGTVPVEQQKRLEQVLGSLDVSQPPKVLEDNINRVQNVYLDIVYGTRAERKRMIEDGTLSPEQHAEIESYYNSLSFDALGRKRDATPAATTGQPQVEIISIRRGD
jgi:hypothetical protein